jgi:hypothetical protein
MTAVVELVIATAEETAHNPFPTRPTWSSTPTTPCWGAHPTKPAQNPARQTVCAVVRLIGAATRRPFAAVAEQPPPNRALDLLEVASATTTPNPTRQRPRAGRTHHDPPRRHRHAGRPPDPCRPEPQARRYVRHHRSRNDPILAMDAWSRLGTVAPSPQTGGVSRVGSFRKLGIALTSGPPLGSESLSADGSQRDTGWRLGAVRTRGHGLTAGSVGIP